MRASKKNQAFAHDLLLLFDDPRPLLQLCFDPSIRRSRVAELLLRLEEIYLYDSRNAFTKMMVENEYGREELQRAGDWPERRFSTVYDVADWVDKNWPDFREEDLWTDELLSP